MIRKPTKSGDRRGLRKGRRSSWPRRLLKWLVVLVLALVCLSFLLLLPLRWFEPPTTAFMLRDDSGRVPVAYHWVDWEALGTALPLAVVAAEDQRFAEHHGIDIDSLRQAVDEARAGGRVRGASTITQQLVKNLFLSSSRSFCRKGIESWLALVADLVLPKRRILELYVNIIELGPGIYGAGAGSDQFFGKTPAQLTDAEAALLAAVLPNPSLLRADAPSAYVRERQAWNLRHIERMRREGWLTRIAD